jgi:hypothetical protein
MVSETPMTMEDLIYQQDTAISAALLSRDHDRYMTACGLAACLLTPPLTY